MGVHYALIPGCIAPTAHRKPICGGMHLWLKAVHHTNDWVLEGFYYFEESIRPRLWAALKLENHPLMQRHPITMSVFDAANASMHRVHTYQPIDLYRPGWLHASIPRPDATPDAQHSSRESAVETVLHPAHSLFIEDWGRYVALTSVLTRAAPWQPVSKKVPDVFTVVGQFYGIPIDRAEQFLAVHTDYHRSIGSAGTIFYFGDEHATLFDHAPRLQALQQRRVLTMVPWPYMAQVAGATTYDQAVIFNHALLSLWGRGAYVFLTDIDELLVAVQPTSFQTLLSGCFQWADHVTLPEYDTLCSACIGDDGQGEQRAWEGKTGLQPLTQYSLRNPKPLATKALVLPGSVFQFFVHDGKLRKSGQTVEVDWERCAYVAHMRNLVHKRVFDVESYVNDTRWMWALQQQ